MPNTKYCSAEASATTATTALKRTASTFLLIESDRSPPTESNSMEDGGGVHKRALTSVADHEGILDEILARLPVKSLMRFRCVCKSWRTLISQPYFVTKHFNYAGRGITENCSRLLISTSPFESIDYEALKDLNDDDAHLAIRKLDFPVMFPDSSVKTIVGSCNGLICLHIGRENLVLWNPCTRDYKVFPKPTIRCTSQFYGFGYDSSTDDYKVMRGYSCRVRDSEETVVQVFSLKTGSWRTHQGLNYFDLAERGCFLNGVLRWLEMPGSRIISFDLGEEKFQEMLPLPYHSGFSYIFSLGDCLCLYISGVLDSQPTGFRIWMMKEYGDNDSWTEVVSSENLPEEYEYSLLTPLCILENGEVLMVKTHKYKSLVLYSSKEQTFRNVVRTRNKWRLDGAIYRETLLSPETSSVADI